MNVKNYIRLIPLMLLMLLSSGLARSQTRSELEARRQQTLREIEQTDRLISQTLKNQRASLDRINLLNGQISQRTRLMTQINAEIALLNREMTQKQREINKLKTELEFLKENYAKMIVSAYKHRGSYDAILLILTAKDLNESYRRMRYFQQFSDARIRQAQLIESKRDTIERHLASLQETRKEKQNLLNIQQKEANQLSGLRKDQQKVTADLRKKESELRRELQAKRKISDELNKAIEKIIAAEISKRTGTSGSTTKSAYQSLTPEEKIISDKFGDNKGRLPWPTETGIVTSAFGQHAHPVFKNTIISNSGIDITTSGRSLVRAVFEGKVLNIFGIKGGNMAVLIQHGNYYSAYQNLVDVMVKQGEKVSLKQNIGRVHADEGAGASTLHFELWYNQTKMNPALWLTPR
jgi:septal ring factor EnvC (AmiA/AmiB activator)